MGYYCSMHTGNTSETHSDIDIQQFSISEASIELKQWNYSNSDLSLQSLKSIASLESQCEDDTLEFMKRFVDILFENCAQLTLELKSEFGLKSRVKRLFYDSFDEFFQCQAQINFSFAD